MGEVKKLHPDNIHEWIIRYFKQNSESLPYIECGLGEDDCSIINTQEKRIVLTTDFLNSSPIALKYNVGNYRDVGRLLVAVNFADLCGTGAKPIGFLSSIMVPKGFLESDFKLLMKGIRYELRKYNTPLLGGDTKIGKAMSLCGTAIGSNYDTNSAFYTLNGGEINQDIWISGEVGAVAAAVNGLSSSNITLSESWYKWAKRVILEPKIPFMKSKYISQNKIATGGTDLSDGLADSVYELCQKSSIGANIEVEKIPLHNNVKTLAKKKGIPSWKYSLSIGGDFQFIITADKKWRKTLTNLGLVKIGCTTVERECLMTYSKTTELLPNQGHTDFNLDSFNSEVESHLKQ